MFYNSISMGALRKGNKSDLVKRIGVPETLPSTPDTTIIDVSQLLYHIAWHHGGAPSDLITSIKARLSQYSDNADKIVAFDKYHGICANVRIDYELSITIAHKATWMRT